MSTGQRLVLTEARWQRERPGLGYRNGGVGKCLKTGFGMVEKSHGDELNVGRFGCCARAIDRNGERIDLSGGMRNQMAALVFEGVWADLFAERAARCGGCRAYIPCFARLQRLPPAK